MTTIEKHPPGHFCWIELGTNDVTGAKRFYGDLFGWTTTDIPMGEELGSYTMGLHGTREVCGMYTLMVQQTQMGIPPHWMIYVSVADCEASTAKAKSLGATCVLEPTTVPDRGILATFLSPQGESFSIWQSLEAKSNGVAHEDGAVSWYELMTKDVAASKAFYKALFDWDLEPMPMTTPDGAPFEYTLIQDGEQQLGGMMQMGPEFGPIPPHWMVYFQVADPDGTVAKAADNGGTIRVPPMDIPVGRFSVLADPAGASFSVIRLNEKC